MKFQYKRNSFRNIETFIESQSRPVSTYSTIIESENMIHLLFKVPHQHDQAVHLISYCENENFLLIYSVLSHQLEYISLKSKKALPIGFQRKEHLLNLGYSTKYHLFYFSSRETGQFVLFRLNQRDIEIERRIELIKQNDFLISVHMYENLVFFLYTSSNVVMLGKYDIETLSFLMPFSFENKLYDDQEQSLYEIIDFTIIYEYACFLIRLTAKNKCMIIIYDLDTMDQLNSFDLIDANRPLSIISTYK